MYCPVPRVTLYIRFDIAQDCLSERLQWNGQWRIAHCIGVDRSCTSRAMRLEKCFGETVMDDMALLGVGQCYSMFCAYCWQRSIVIGCRWEHQFLASAEDGNHLARSAVPSQCRASRGTFFLSQFMAAEAWQLFSFLPYKTSFSPETVSLSTFF